MHMFWSSIKTAKKQCYKVLYVLHVLEGSQIRKEFAPNNLLILKRWENIGESQKFQIVGYWLIYYTMHQILLMYSLHYNISMKPMNITHSWWTAALSFWQLWLEFREGLWTRKPQIWSWMFDAFTSTVIAVTWLSIGIITFWQPVVITGQWEQYEYENYVLPTLLDIFFAPKSVLTHSARFSEKKAWSLELQKKPLAISICTMPKIEPVNMRYL